jgi:hypothetical protein
MKCNYLYSSLSTVKAITSWKLRHSFATRETFVETKVCYHVHKRPSLLPAQIYIHLVHNFHSIHTKYQSKNLDEESRERHKLKSEVEIKRILEKSNVEAETDSGYGQMLGFCEHVNEPSAVIET